MLKKIHKAILEEAAASPGDTSEVLPTTAEEYAAAREAYLKSDRKNAF